MFDDQDLAHLDALISQARSKLAKTAGYLPDELSESLQELLNQVDEFHEDILDEDESDE